MFSKIPFSDLFGHASHRRSPMSLGFTGTVVCVSGFTVRLFGLAHLAARVFRAYQGLLRGGKGLRDTKGSRSS
eukprot:3955297-Amphidinium_carterae.1